MERKSEKQAKTESEQEPCPPQPKLEPLRPLRGEPESNLERREEYFRKRHGAG
jgi:hypothetical protein